MAQALVGLRSADNLVVKTGRPMPRGTRRAVPSRRHLAWAALVALAAPWSARASHAYAQFGDIKYPPGFEHFDWVNPDAPKGGEITLAPGLRITQFDKYNPFTLKGIPPPGLTELMFESLLTGTLDEPTTAYCLLADDVEVAPDRLSTVFHINASARFQDGQPVLAADVKHSFDMLTSRLAHPAYQQAFAEVRAAVVLDDHRIRFDFKRPALELPLVVGGMPIFSRTWGKGKPFDHIVTDLPVVSGPYRIERVDFGRDLTYRRDPNYWGRDLPVRRGLYNFDRVTYKIYKDTTAQTEAFLAGEFDYVQVFSAREWVKTYRGKRFDSGTLIRRLLPSHNPADFQGWFINTRRPQLVDPRVRRALGLALDFEWMNRRFFYGSYTRVRGFFDATDFEAKGLPSPEELAILEPLRGKLAPEVFTEPAPVEPPTDPPGSLRANLRQANALLTAAGWTYRDGALRNGRGEPFAIQILDSEGALGRVVAPYVRALQKLGITPEYRVVDFALLEKRLDDFDFDLTNIRIPGSLAPGIELKDRFESTAASSPGSSNLAGVRDPAVDSLVELAIAATSRPELVARLKSLDRVLRHGYYVVPGWYTNSFRVSYRAKKFAEPKKAPDYYQPEAWILETWWAVNR